MDGAMSFARAPLPQDDPPRDRPAFWTTGNGDALHALAARPEGLTSAEAKERLKHYGPNVAVASVRRGLLVKLVRRFTEPLVAILLIAAAVSGATGDWQSFVVIVLIVLFSVTLDMVQEQKAEIGGRCAETVGRGHGCRPPRREDPRASR